MSTTETTTVFEGEPTEAPRPESSRSEALSLREPTGYGGLM